MWWVFRSNECSIVTGIAIRRGIAELSIFVTGGTIIRDGRMGTCQWIKSIVIECTWSPTWICGVARGTIGRKLRCHMVRIFGSLIGGVVTGITVLRGIAVLAIDVTGGTIIFNGRMCAS